MSDHPEKPQTVQQIAAAWDAARRELEALRRAVQQAEKMAETGSRGAQLLNARDRALRDLGEAVMAQVEAGALSLPAELNHHLEAVARARAEVSDHAADVADLLAEGEAAAERLSPPKKDSTGRSRKG